MCSLLSDFGRRGQPPGMQREQDIYAPDCALLCPPSVLQKERGKRPPSAGILIRNPSTTLADRKLIACLCSSAVERSNLLPVGGGAAVLLFEQSSRHDGNTAKGLPRHEGVT